MILFYPESPYKQIPSRFPDGALMDGDTRLQGISTYLNKNVTSALIGML
jgi:hypothetical protein